MPRERKRHRLMIIFVSACAVAGALFFVTGERRQAGEAKPDGDSGAEEERVTDTPTGVAETKADVEGVPTVELALDDLVETAQKKMEIPPIDWRTQLIESLDGESIEETARNFHDPNDLSLAVSSLSMPCGMMDTQAEALLVTRLTRVRKLIEIGSENPELVVPLVRDVMREALGGYSDVREIYFRERAGKFPATREPAVQFQMRILCCTYILAELGDHESLPLMLQSWRQHDEKGLWSAAPPGFTLYAMHRLVSTFPEERLSTQAAYLQAKYLEAAECVPQHREVEVTRWSAAYMEADPRILLFDPAERTLEGLATMKISIWPHCYRDGTAFNEGRKVPEQTRKLFALLQEFVEEAFPDHAP